METVLEGIYCQSVKFHIKSLQSIPYVNIYVVRLTISLLHTLVWNSHMRDFFLNQPLVSLQPSL